MIPKLKIEQFLKAWIANDKKLMYSHCQLTWKKNNSKTKLNKFFFQKLKGYSLLEERTKGAVSDIDIKLAFKDKTAKVTARLICEEEAYKPSINGKWGLNPISLTKNLY